MSAYETPLRAPKTADYRPNLDDNMDSFPDLILDSEPEETPPASQLEPRHKAELAKQNNYKVKHLAQAENLPKNSQSKRQPRKRKHEGTISALQFKKQKLKPPYLNWRDTWDKRLALSCFSVR